MITALLLAANLAHATGSCDSLSPADWALAQRLATAGCAPKDIHLTFDDGPMPGSEQVVQALNQEGVRATFFISTVNLSPRRAAVNCNGEAYDVSADAAVRNREFVRAVVDGGHHVASHGHQHHPYDLTHMDPHPSAFYLGEQQRQREIVLSRQLLEETAGFTLAERPPVLYRMPYAAGAVVRVDGRVSTPRARDFVAMRGEGRDYGATFAVQLEQYAQTSPALASLAADGFSHLAWNYSSDDWNRPANLTSFVHEQATRLCRSQVSPTVALFHDIQPHTRAGTGRIVKILKCLGQRFIGVEELMNAEASLREQNVLTSAEAPALTLEQLLGDGPVTSTYNRICPAGEATVTLGQCRVAGRRVPHGSCLWNLPQRSVCLNGNVITNTTLYHEMCGGLDG